MVGVSFVLNPEERDGTWDLTAVDLSKKRVRENTEDPGDSQKEWQDISKAGQGSKNWVKKKRIKAVTLE